MYVCMYVYTYTLTRANFALRQRLRMYLIRIIGISKCCEKESEQTMGEKKAALLHT
jgi:hypothetical protein